jgi:hypothetical protein
VVASPENDEKQDSFLILAEKSIIYALRKVYPIQ